VQYALTADGVSIAFTTVGEGAPLVYLQPHSHTLREWELPETRAWYGLLAERHRLVRLDIRHFGLSQRDAGPITVDTCVADVEAVVCRLGLERFDLMGVSGQSAAAALYAVRHPEHVRHLVLWSAASTGAAWYGSGLEREPRYHAMELLPAVDPDLALEVHGRFMFGERPPPRSDQREFVLAAMRAEDLGEYMKYIRDLDVTGFLPGIEAPTLVVFPRRSEYVALDAARRVAAAIPNCEFVDCDTEMYPFQGPDLNQNLKVFESFLALGRSGPIAGHPVRLVRSCELSGREREVLALIAAGKTNPEIAEALTIAPATASRHVHNIFGKLGMSRRSEAAAYALREGLVE
jgi:pimeloyl-ACP methyl ester carboxylesterase/DNA-binding CsgD family transcriptional regulator